MECLNYVQSSNFAQQPYPGFSACRYAVPPTKCSSVVDGDVIELGTRTSHAWVQLLFP